MRAALQTIHPGSFWRGTELVVPVESRLRVRPAGRGVTLLPSTLWAGRPLVDTHPDGSILLVYAAATPLPLVSQGATAESLDRLLGATRAAALRLASRSASTTQLARQLDVSPASASEHATVLRQAGLIETVRDGRSVRHATTPLGDRLLSGW